MLKYFRNFSKEIQKCCSESLLWSSTVRLSFGPLFAERNENLQVVRNRIKSPI